jgi:hypothetical protein
MEHKCNSCGKEMHPVDDIEIKGIKEIEGKKIRGWRCRCGNEHSNPEDVDILVDYYKALRLGVNVSLFKSGNSWAVRLPAALIRALRLKPSSRFSLAIEGKKIVLTPTL